MLSRLLDEALILVRLLTRPAIWVLLVLTIVGAAGAYQVRHEYAIDVGGPGDRLPVRNFHDPRTEQGTGRTFRWSDAYGYVDLPGTGGGTPFTVTLTLNTGRPDVPLTVIVNGEMLLQETYSEGWRALTVAVGSEHRQALSARDIVVELRTPGYPAADDPTQIQGVMLDRVDVSPSGPGIVIPTTIQLAYIAGAVLLVYLFVGRIFAPLGRPSLRTGRSAGFRLSRSELPGLLCAAVAAIGLVVLLAVEHLPLTAAASELVGPIAAAFVASYLLIVLGEAVGRWITPQSLWGARAIAGLVGVAFLLRFGAVTLPQVNIIDLPWHMKWLRELLVGHWESLYFPGELSSVPREWGLAVLIPKSPLFYFVAAPLAVLPWSLETSVKAFACLLDVFLMVFCYGLLARFAPRLGGWKAGLWAAAAYAFNPLSYRSLAYGILPTILAQWLTVAAFTVLLVLAARLMEQDRRSVRGLVALFLLLLAASLVAFPTIAVFNTMVLGLLALAWLWRSHEPGEQHAGWAVVGATAAAWMLALLVYYGQYVSILINTTIPALLNPDAASAQTVSPGTGTEAVVSGEPATVDWNGPLDLLGWTAGYLVSLIPLLAGLTGLALLWSAASKDRKSGLLSSLTGAWMVILPVFLAANYKVDMIGKHLFYTVVPLSLGAGIFLWQVMLRGRAARVLSWLIAGALAWAGLAFWVMRLVQASG
jgi:hypothetical protein